MVQWGLWSGFVLGVLTILAGFVVAPLKREVPRREPKPIRETFAYRWSRLVQHHRAGDLDHAGLGVDERGRHATLAERFVRQRQRQSVSGVMGRTAPDMVPRPIPITSPVI